jgi:hypothetical protein
MGQQSFSVVFLGLAYLDEQGRLRQTHRHLGTSQATGLRRAQRSRRRCDGYRSSPLVHDGNSETKPPAGNRLERSTAWRFRIRAKAKQYRLGNRIVAPAIATD